MLDLLLERLSSLSSRGSKWEYQRAPQQKGVFFNYSDTLGGNSWRSHNHMLCTYIYIHRIRLFRKSYLSIPGTMIVQLMILGFQGGVNLFSSTLGNGKAEDIVWVFGELRSNLVRPANFSIPELLMSFFFEMFRWIIDIRCQSKTNY